MLFKVTDGNADFPHAYALKRESYTSEARFVSAFETAVSWCGSKFGPVDQRWTSDDFTIAFASSADADAFFHTVVY